MSTTLLSNFEFHCYGCGESAAVEPRGASCSHCGEPLSVRFAGEGLPTCLESPPESLWHYRAFLPVANADCIVSLGEGATRLVDAPRLAAKFGFEQLLLKNETSNPTGSFKDRQVSVGISHARELGMDTVAVVSSGNVACAAAAYAARAGMRAVLFMHGMAAPGKIAQAAAYGAKVLCVDSPSAGAVFELCVAACDRFGWYHLSTSGMHEPYNVEGAKTIAYELFHQTGGNVPDWLVAPVGGGGLLGGIWRGFLDLQRVGVLNRIPRLAGVQAAGCAPVKQAIDKGTPFLETLKNPWPNPKTIAGGIADDIIFDGHTVLPAIRTTNGLAPVVTDDEIIAGELLLASAEGILCEPSCAVVIAALNQLPRNGRDTRVCCVITGTGIKDLDAIRNHVTPPVKIPATLKAVDQQVNS